MGAVQKLATVVIVGLVALASVLVVYLADEPNRRAAEAAEQEEVAIARGIETFIANCVTCHGPGGEGASADDGRIGAPLGGNTEEGRAQQEINQSDDPVERAARHRYIVQTLQNGKLPLMPAWGSGAEGGALLNDEQIEELALMIQNVDWDEVYNETVLNTREQIAAAGSPVPETGGVYPTAGPVPQLSQPRPTAAAMNTAQDPEATPAPEGGQEAAQAPAVTIEGFDIGWRSGGQETAPNQPITVAVAPSSVITLPNVGAIGHNFAVDAFDDLVVDMPVGETVEYTVPADTAPGDYEFYCNVPGHAPAGMVGILRVEAAAAAAPAAASPAGTPPAEQAAAPAAAGGGEPVVLEGFDIGWTSNGQSSAPGAPVNLTVSPGTTISLPNVGAGPHNFAVDALAIDQDMPVGETVEVTIPADAAPGEYEYYCNVPGHKQAGMVGTLTIQ